MKAALFNTTNEWIFANLQKYSVIFYKRSKNILANWSYIWPSSDYVFGKWDVEILTPFFNKMRRPSVDESPTYLIPRCLL